MSAFLRGALVYLTISNGIADCVSFNRGGVGVNWWIHRDSWSNRSWEWFADFGILELLSEIGELHARVIPNWWIRGASQRFASPRADTLVKAIRTKKCRDVVSEKTLSCNYRPIKALGPGSWLGSFSHVWCSWLLTTTCLSESTYKNYNLLTYINIRLS